MTANTVSYNQRSLPQLSGRLLWFYRVVWCALAIWALLTSALWPLQSASHPAVLVLRLAKSAVLICVAVILFSRRPRDSVAALLALAFLTWTITSSVDFWTGATLAQLLDRLRFLLFALALLLFPDGHLQPGWGRPLAAASLIAFLIGVAEALRVLPSQLFLPWAIACVLAAIGSLVARFRASEDYALKQQLKWVALGLVVGVSLILSARAGLALRVKHISEMPILWEALFQLGIIIIAVGFLVPLLRYRLFDAETVISRSAAYAMLTIALVATFGGTEALIQNIGQDYLGMNIGGISGGMAAAVAAVLLNPLHGRIGKWAENRFQPDLVQLKRQLPNVLASAGASTSTRHVAEAVLPLVNAAIHATRSAFVLDGQVVGAAGVQLRQAQNWWTRSFGELSDFKTRDDADPIFPLRLPIGHAASGSAWLVLGPRPDRTLYGKEDLDAVRSTLPAVHRALTAARAREQITATIKLREKGLRQELGEIRARLRKLEWPTIQCRP